MKMVPWAVAELSAAAEVLELALAEVVVAALERIPVADVVVRADLLQELLALQRGQLVAATMKKYQV